MYGGVQEVTINRDFFNLRTKLCRRNTLIKKLETTETTLIKRVNQKRRLSQREDDNDGDDSTSLPSWIKYLH
jgi:hypothetical protein